MAVRKADARWEGTLKEGKGNLKVGSGAYNGGYSFSSRFEEGSPNTNPEELIAAAHAGCFSMALNASLERAGTPANYIQTTANVNLTKGDAGMGISQIDLVTEGEVPGIDAAAFQKAAEETLKGCIISRALSAVPMTVNATLK
jgi:osmotically inducible protein OsmC